MICLKKKSDGKCNTCKNGKLVNSFNGTTAPIFSEHVIAQKIEYEWQQKLSSRVIDDNRKKEVICFIQWKRVY